MSKLSSRTSKAHRRRTSPRGFFEQLDPRLLLSADSCQIDRDEAVAEIAVQAPVSADTYSARDAGNTAGTAFDLGQLGAPRSYDGSVGGRDIRDVMRFSLADEARVDIGLGNLRADIDLALYDGSGRLLAQSIRAGSASESITATLDAGVYYIAVTPRRRAISTYVLSVGATITEPPPAVPPTSDPTEPPPSGSPVTAFPDVAYYGGANDWNLNAVDAPESWAQGYKGDGVVVAVVDTGVDVNHPDLINQFWVNAGEIAGNGIDDDGNGYVDDVSGWDFVSGDNNPDDGNGHGTHVAGTIAADDNGFGATGVAPDATIMPVRVLDNNGSGTSAAVAAGIRYAAQMGADIINLSLGGGFSSTILAAIEYALQFDVLVVAAAGNESASAPGYPALFSASLSNVISVGAYSSSGVIASFSDHVGSSGAVQVDAPGVSVYSTYMGGQYGRLSGTSMAAPHVSGLAALALSANNNLTASQLRTLITDGADRTIVGSDSFGGVNAALTVALAAAGQTSGGPTAATTQAQVAGQTISVRRFLSSRAVIDSALPLPSESADPAASPEPARPDQFAAAPSEVSPPMLAARDVALLAMDSADQDKLDAESSDTDLDLFAELESCELLDWIGVG
jgi:Subtilase family/Bacterial pre-peptidase C-terminal domain